MRLRTLSWLLSLGVLLPVHAAAQTSFDARDFVKGSLVFSKGEDLTGYTLDAVKWKTTLEGDKSATGADCGLVVGSAEGRLEQSRTACGGLWSSSLPEKITVEVSKGGNKKTYPLTPAQSQSGEQVLKEKISLTPEGVLSGGSGLANKELVLGLPRNDRIEWTTVKLGADGKAQLDANRVGLVPPEAKFQIYTVQEDKSILFWLTQVGDAADASGNVDLSASERRVGAGAIVQRGGPLSQATGYRCHDVYPEQADLQIICAVALNDRITVTRVPSQHVVRPNRGFLIAVWHLPDQEVTVSIDGTPGLFDAPLRANVDSNTGNRLQAGRDKKKKPELTLYTFAPRQPGNLNVIITLTRNGAPISERLVELIVEQTYSGAIRIGVATVWGGAVDRSYDARTVPGSNQEEVVQTATSKVDLELVIGFAPFLEQAWGGRGYATSRRLSDAPYGLSPYFGIGILNENKNALELLKSVHLGVEWEMNPHFSVAATYVLRRVERLGRGITVGSPVGPEGIYTTQSYQSGWGLVFNVSPEFLRFARRDGASFFDE
jgi:hypothetical protein